MIENTLELLLAPIAVDMLKDNLVIESLTGKRVIPFDSKNPEDQEILDLLKQTALVAGKTINEGGISRARANEVGNDIEGFVKAAMQKYHLNPDIPSGASGRKKAMGYPDIIFHYNPHSGKNLRSNTEKSNDFNQLNCFFIIAN